MATYLTIDIGGTFIKYALLNENQELIHKEKTSTKQNKDQAIIKQVWEIVTTYNTRFSLSGVGISTAGIVDREKGEVIYAGPTIPAYLGTNFKERLKDFDLPICVANDVDAALLGEIWKGEASTDDNVFCLTLGTGIGGAWYQNGLIDGANFQANSIGYLLYDENTQTNFEMRASTKALEKIIENVYGDDWSVPDVFSKAKQGDPSCIQIIEDWAKEVAKGIAEIILIADPTSIIIGGGVSAQGTFLQQQIEQQVEKFLPKNFLKTNIKIATQQNDAALYGAVYPFMKARNEGETQDVFTK